MIQFGFHGHGMIRKFLVPVIKEFGYTPEILDISSLNLEQISNLLNSHEIVSDCVLFTNCDPWRFDDSSIFNFGSLKGKTVILQTMGYANTKYSPLHYKLSFPPFYFIRHMPEVDILSTDLDYGFSCLNNTISPERLVIGDKFYSLGLLDKIIFSQNLNDNDNHFLERLLEDSQDIYSYLNLPNLNKYTKLLPISYEEDTSKFFSFTSHEEHMRWAMSTEHPAWKKAYCNIVVETTSTEYPFYLNLNRTHMSEKSQKPFSSKQIPLIVGGQGHYAYLKSLGFEMMEDLLPTGYDNMPFLEKVNAMASVVEKGKEFIKDFYFSHLKEIEHNYKLVMSDSVEHKILNNIRSVFQ